MSVERFGLLCEVRAIRYLYKAGLRVQKTRVKTRYGEIDLVALSGETLVFVEVKAGSFGQAALRVDERKRARLRNAASDYLLENPAKAVRFDVLEMSKNGVRLIENAF